MIIPFRTEVDAWGEPDARDTEPPETERDAMFREVEAARDAEADALRRELFTARARIRMLERERYTLYLMLNAPK